MSPGPTSVPCHPAASKSLQIVAHIDGPISGTKNLTNYVDVSGQPEHGQNVTANASADVQAQEAKIAVSKTADPTFGSPSTNVTFTLHVDEYGQRSSAACLRQRSSAGWHELHRIFIGQHPSRPECLLVRHRSHVIRFQQIAADRSPYRWPHIRHQKSDQLRGRFRPTRARPECHGQCLRRSCTLRKPR